MLECADFMEVETNYPTDLTDKQWQKPAEKPRIPVASFQKACIIFINIF